jgi:acyl-CoA synthetase (AMP-forming)/AMP-acid ligase II
MKGYFNRPADTAEVIDSDGWLHSGDLGYYDEEGQFYVVDRLKELIKVKGYQVGGPLTVTMFGLFIFSHNMAAHTVGGLTSLVSMCCTYRPSLRLCQVAPAELEEILRSHPEIEDAAVFGVPNERAGEVPRAFVVPRRPDISEEDVKQFVAAKVSEHKWLKGGVQFVTRIPKSPSGKILRRDLKDVL